MYQLLYDFVGFDVSTLECPELCYNFVAGMSCVLIVSIIYLVLWFFITLFRGQK